MCVVGFHRDMSSPIGGWNGCGFFAGESLIPNVWPRYRFVRCFGLGIRQWIEFRTSPKKNREKNMVRAQWPGGQVRRTLFRVH